MVKTRVSYESNPNGNLWLKDNSGFGQKMLAKMGWKEGQGLGRTEQGITAAIRVSRKRDNRGVGCSRQWAEEGSAQMDAFSAVLADLNRHQESSARSEGDNDADQPIGLEESSRRSRNRLHYAKFTRGKDLSRCSEQALLSIMGPRGVQQLNEKKEEKEEPKIEDSGLRHVHSSLSTAEYFAQKMEAMRARLKASASAPVLYDNRGEEEEEGEMKEGEGSGLFSPRPTFQLGGDVSDQLEEGELSQHSIPTSPVPAAFEAAVAENEKLQKKRRKEKRKKRRRECENEEIEGCISEDAEKNEEESKTDDRREERKRRKEERRKRRRERENEEVEGCISEDAENEEESKTDDRKEERRRRKEERRRRRQERYSAAMTEKEEEEEEADDDLSKLVNVVSEKEEIIESRVLNNEENVSKKKRKKKRKHRTQSSESEEESVSKKPKIRPTSAPMTDEEAASFAFENQGEIEKDESSKSPRNRINIRKGGF